METIVITHLSNSRGIIPPIPLPDNVLFENGKFNPYYVPDGFDFMNNVYDYDNETTHIPPAQAGIFPNDALGTNKVLKCHCANQHAFAGEDWYIEDGCLTYNHVLEPAPTRRNTHTWLFIPVVNIKDIFGDSTNSIVAVYRCFQENTSYQKQLMIYAGNAQLGDTKMTNVETKTPGGVMVGNTVDTTASLENWQDDDSIYKLRLVRSELYNDYCYIGFHMYMYEYANNPRSIKFQIKKIYVNR